MPLPQSIQDWNETRRWNWLRGASHVEKDPQHNMVSLPGLWTFGEPYQETLTHHAAQKILKSLFEEKVALSAIHWRQLEEIIAEILLGLGLEVKITKRSWDGGRDVIAQGELLPGEPTLLAVEVKQMPVVPIGELRKALWANRHYPALLFATSGRFSAGIFREKSHPESTLRLFLKDGVAISQWIDMYAQIRGWDK